MKSNALGEYHASEEFRKNLFYSNSYTTPDFMKRLLLAEDIPVISGFPHVRPRSVQYHVSCSVSWFTECLNEKTTLYILQNSFYINTFLLPVH